MTTLTNLPEDINNIIDKFTESKGKYLINLKAEQFQKIKFSKEIVTKTDYIIKNIEILIRNGKIHNKYGICINCDCKELQNCLLQNGIVSELSQHRLHVLSYLETHTFYDIVDKTSKIPIGFTSVGEAEREMLNWKAEWYLLIITIP